MSLALISILTVSIATILERVLMKNDDSDPISYAIVFQFMLGSISLIFALFFGRFVFPSLSILGSRFILATFLWAGSTVFSFSAMKRLTAGEVTVLTTSSTVVSVVLGVLLLREPFSLRIFLGIVLILLSVWLVNSAKVSFASKQGVGFALLAATFCGVAVVNDLVILKNYEAFSYTAVMSFLPGLALMFIFPGKAKKIRTMLKLQTLKVMSIFCFFYSIQAITYYLAFQAGAPVSLLSPLIKTSIILTVILGVIFLGERNNLLRKIVASLLVTIGAVFLG